MHQNQQQLFFSALLSITVLTQIIFLYAYHPVLFNDSIGFEGLTYVPLSYRELAINFVNGDMSSDLGARSPGYPVLMATCFYFFGTDNYESIVILQCLFGVLLFFSAYWLWSQIFDSRMAALAATATAVLEPAVILSGSNILTESLSIILLVTSLALIIYSARSSRLNLITSLLAGLCVAWLALTRPSFQMLIPLYGIYIAIVMRDKIKTKTAIVSILLFLIGSSTPVIGWNTYNYYRFDYFTMMTTQGYILTSHSAHLIEGHPEKYGEYEDIAGIVDKYARETGWGIWEAYPEIMNTRNASFIESSKLTEKMSLLIFKENLLAYTKSVLKAVKRFWESELFTGNDLRDSNAFSFINAAYSLLHQIGIIMFFSIVIMDILKPRFWLDHGVIERMLIYGIVLMLCASSTIPIAVENARYKIPLLPLIWGVVAGSLVTNFRNIRQLYQNWH